MKLKEPVRALPRPLTRATCVSSLTYSTRRVGVLLTLPYQYLLTLHLSSSL